MQFVAGPYRLEPGQLAADAENAAGRPELAGDAELHRQRRSVPAARRKTAKHRPVGGGLVEMEGLRIELGGETLDRVGIDAQRRRRESLADGEILEIMHAH